MPAPATVASTCAVLADRLGMPARRRRRARDLGPRPGDGGHRAALSTAVAPELTLPTIDGEPFDLSSLRGQKVLLVAWASW